MCAHSADVDAELGLITCVWGGVGQRPDRPSQRGVAHGFGLIPVSVSEASVQVGGGVGQRK